ncbi:bifunctional diguanylate cyclase/phosphodiesterase [Vibrio navarrensis]|uniref:bifunctional diguanylate cyclase/phosphodiesterase n=1 Tax=Vibrio navarrensis TaxID=29495 RepID=UPI002095B4CA|nr:EAL domain-containing protein [Vibrio navarrensis]
MSLNWALFQESLSRRFIFITLLLLISVQTISFTLVNIAVDAHVREEIKQSLEVSKRVWNQLLAQSNSMLQESAEVLASDFGFRSAVATQDQNTIASALLNNAQRINASIAILIDANWQLKAASSEAILLDDPSIYKEIIQRFDKQKPFQLMMYNGKPTQFVLAPVRAPRVIGYVLLGFDIDQERILQASQLAGIEIALLSSSTGAQTINVVASSEAIAGYFLSTNNSMAENSSLLQDIVINQEIFVSGVISEQTSTQHWVHVVFLESLPKASEKFDQLATQYLTVSGVGIIIFTLAIFALSHRTIKPLITLTEATAELEKGNFSSEIEGTDRPDEIGQLARGFDKMRSSIEEQRETITQLAYFDPLTRLPNRLNFKQKLSEAMASNTFRQISVITLNLDRFKQVNDVLGYEVGDRVLKTVAERLSNTAHTRPAMTAHVSGDEFSVMLDTSHLPPLEATLQLKHCLDDAFEIEGTQIDLSVSIGIASWPTDAADPDSLIHASQIAMYAAKSKKEQIVVYNQSLVMSAPQNLSLLSELRRAVRENELRVFLQAKVDTRSALVSAAEALIRWQHPSKGMIAPYQFVPFAEQTGFVREITKWVIREVVSQWHHVQPLRGQMIISINLSTWDLMTGQLPAFLDSLLSEFKVPAEGICLEITESAIMEDPKVAQQTLNELAKMGFHLSIDDFGTGYSSLGYLKQLPVNELKVDKSFVLNMIENNNDRIIVSSTIELAHNLGLRVVAEGVETRELLDALAALQCDEAQGYYINKPMPINEFVAWRDQWCSQHT